MSYAIKPEAILDILYIGNKLEVKMKDFSLSEIQFFAYFSCLLSLYDGNTIESWTYSFIKSDLGSPYSSDIHRALETLITNNFLYSSEETPGYYCLSERGKVSLKFYETLSTLASRIKYLDTSCRSISLMPFGLIKEAINKEPVIKSANVTFNKKNLLEESNIATQHLRYQFASLKKALETEYSDLILPAMVWLDSLNYSQ